MIHIKNAKTEDVPHVAGLFDLYRQFYGKKTDLLGATEFLQKRLSRGESTLFIATEVLESPEPVGFVHCYKSFSSLRMKPVVILNDLYVLPEWRGRAGVAEKLILKVHEMACANEAIAVVLETAPDNFRAQSLYRRLGYKEGGTLTMEFTINSTSLIVD